MPPGSNNDVAARRRASLAQGKNDFFAAENKMLKFDKSYYFQTCKNFEKSSKKKLFKKFMR